MFKQPMRTNGGLHRTPAKKRKPDRTTEFCRLLTDLGFEVVKTNNPDGGLHRRILKKKVMRVLANTDNQPFWTIQRMRGAVVEWFVDVPIEAGFSVLENFILAIELDDNSSAADIKA